MKLAFWKKRSGTKVALEAASPARTSSPAPTLPPALGKWLLLGLLSFVVGLIIFVPARLFESIVNRALAPQAQVQIGAGTLWSGRAVLQLSAVSVDGAGNTAIPFTWRFDALALLRLRLGVAVESASPALTGTARIGLGVRTIAIRDANLRIDARLIAAFNSLLNLVGPSGTLQIDTANGDALTTTYQGVPVGNSQLKVRVANIMLRSIAPRVLGSYEIDIGMRDAAAEYRIAQASGPLKLDGGGNLRWSTPNQFTYRGVASATAADADILAPLRAFGQPAGDGRLQIDFQTGW